MTPIAKRRRTARSCEQCRQRKVACDQGHPCGPCDKSRDRLICTYRDTAPAPAAAAAALGQLAPVPAASNVPESGPGSAGDTLGRAYAHHASRFEVFDSGLGPALRNWSALGPARASSSNDLTEPSAPRFEPQPPAAHAQQLEDKVQRLEERIRRLEDDARNVHRHAAPGEVPSSILPAIAKVAPRLRYTTGKVKLFPQSHWVHTAEKVCSHFMAIRG